MNLDRAASERLVRALAQTIVAHADELTSLDQAIGDGDHGLNMKRGFDAVLATLPGMADKTLPEMLKGIGTTLVMKVGGASGPLFGTFFMEFGRNSPRAPIWLPHPTRRLPPSRSADAPNQDRKPCSMCWCRRISCWLEVAMRARSPPRRRRQPSGRFRCWRSAVARRFSASGRSDTWIPGRARRRC
jgi:hypothetical protein